MRYLVRYWIRNCLHFSCISQYTKSCVLSRYFHRKMNAAEEFKAACEIGLQMYPKISDKYIPYGTSGFRDKAEELPHVMYRMGLLAVLKSKAEQGNTVGVIITASHNPEEDNGVKLCEPSGVNLSPQWEVFAMQLANAGNEQVEEVLKEIARVTNIDYNTTSSVYLARDTRSSSSSLLSAAMLGVSTLKGEAKDFGLLTTPQMHFIVYCKTHPSYGFSSTEGYYEKLSSAFEYFFLQATKKEKYVPEVYVDCSNGVGAVALKEFQNHLKSLRTIIVNDGSNGVLNFNCGADFVKTEQKLPTECTAVNKRRYASFDGDADRLIYFYCDDAQVFHLLDGSKIAVLVAKYIKDLLQKMNLELVTRIIQTAYANGSSTDYMNNVLNIPVICVPTGVKHLHHEALKYEIGIYFEANGHGTILFSDQAKGKIHNLASDSSASETQRDAAKKLASVINLINETVGDAISDMLLVEVILHDLDWTVEDWDSMYTDYPYCLKKVKVPDRSAVKTMDAGRKCTEPIGLQEAVDSVVLQYKNARSFVRPSGTEDVVRVYAEASTQGHADKLAEEVSNLVQNFTAR